MASWLQGLAGWVRRRPDSWAAEVAFRRAWNSLYRYPPPPGRRGMILPISSWSMGSWAPGPLAEGQLAWTAPGWIRGRLAAVVAGGGSCAASPLLRWPSLLFRGSWCWGGCPLPRLVAPVWLRTALPCPVLVGGAPHWAPVWQGYSSTRHRSGFLWAPPTQDTGRCCRGCLFGVLQAVGIRRADGMLVMTVAPPRVCVLMAGLSWGAMIAHAPQVCSPTQPESNQSDSGQVKL